MEKVVMNRERIVSILNDVNMRLFESTRYEMDFAEREINDCINLINVVIGEMEKDNTDSV